MKLQGTPYSLNNLEKEQKWGSYSPTRLSDFTFTFHFHALEKEMATHSSALAWRIPGTGESGGLPSLGSHRVGHNWSDLAAAAAYFTISKLATKLQKPKPVVLSKGYILEVKWRESHSVVSDSLWPHGQYSPWNSPGQNIGVGSLSLLQWIFSTQESNCGLLHWRQNLY